jgi:hypothetical protein
MNILFLFLISSVFESAQFEFCFSQLQFALIILLCRNEQVVHDANLHIDDIA